jgi:hypothetical protein
MATFLVALASTSISAVVGALSSLLVAWYYDRATAPRLEIIPDDTPRQTGQHPGSPRHQFLQVKARQVNGRWPFVSRRAAWNCRGIMEVFKPDGNKAISERITARWSGSLQPFRSQVVGQQVAQIPDESLFPFGQRFEVYSYSDEQIALAVKFEGGDDCWIFSNESYLFQWRNPSWRLPRGQYFIRFQLYYESKKPTMQWISLVNNGSGFGDWSATFVDQVPFQ